MKNISIITLVFFLIACGSVPASQPTTPPTSLPTSTPLPPTPTATPTPLPTGPCDNPLVPLAMGNRWVYRAITPDGEALYNLESVEIRNEANTISIFDFTDQKHNQTVQEPVVCQNGAIENFPLFVTTMLLSDYVDTAFNTYHDTGVYAPSHQTLNENNWQMDWNTNYLTEEKAHLKNPMGGSDLIVLESSAMKLTFHTNGEKESVTTPAGDFPQAIKVLRSFSMSVTITLPTGGTNGILTLEATELYEPYIGLVRSQITSASLETQGTTIPVEIESVLELLEFHPGE